MFLNTGVTLYVMSSVSIVSALFVRSLFLSGPVCQMFLNSTDSNTGDATGCLHCEVNLEKHASVAHCNSKAQKAPNSAQKSSGDNRWCSFLIPLWKRIVFFSSQLRKRTSDKMEGEAAASIRGMTRGNTLLGKWTTLSRAGMVATGESNRPMGAEYVNYKRQIMSCRRCGKEAGQTR